MGWTVKHCTRHPSLKMALAIALALASSTAAALGLGQIDVKSRSGQPLLAEIPIVSNDPAELEQLQARLASPDTFTRVGLQPPQGIVSGLQFTVALDNSGSPVIRVTSAEPVTQPLLTFLVEVDWGQGRLVREYSALIDTPQTVSAPSQPAIQAPVVAPPNVIERPVQSFPPPSANATPIATQPAPSRAPDTTIGVPPTPVPAATPQAPAAAPSNEYGPVKRGESLSQVAGRLDVGGASLDQTMVALLRANPDSFIGGDLNQLKQGAVLRVPDSDALTAIDAAQASEIVRGQVRQWRDARRAVPQPASAASADSASSKASTMAGNASAPRSGGARLEIAPPGASRAMRAGTQSGINAGGEGKMLRQELQETKESLAARDAELQELKSRIADLEKLQADQQQLMALKDSELAAAQQRLATSQATPATPPPATATTNDSTLPWVFGGAGLLLVMLVGGWWMRGRSKPKPGFRVPHTAPSPLAAAFPSAPEPAADGARMAAPATPAAVAVPALTVVPAPKTPPAPAPAAKPAPVSASASASEPASAAETDPLPFWDRRERSQMSGGRVAAPAAAPAWHTGGAARMDAPPAAPLPVSDAAAAERLELAQAYLDLGDRDSARQLLSEVAVNGDHATRQQATRMLRELE
ncbi:FimV/HubP family polar landmark protein [Lysobacter koreensis]|uniref:FimV/HubP family polar landmark protein n=1 Tax=Lysobacter koreensis TaxID=266122 RepID=A0ABW2YHN9_9GAMM